jgi:putative membrane protein
MTLLLGALPRRPARGVVRLLHSGFARFLCHPLVALVLNVGGMGLLYFTPLHDLAADSPALQGLMQLHFLLAGYLFAWSIAGPDPAPGPPSVPYRLVILGAAIFLHSTFSQLLYAGWFVQVDVPLAQRLGGAELMYYGGDIAELLLALAMLSTWRPASRSGPALA